MTSHLHNYTICSDGSVISNRTNTALIGGIDNKGYKRYCLCFNGTQTTYKAHRLIASAFIPNPENKPQVNHKNGIKTDNRVKNLEWVTNQQNAKHAFDNGLKPGFKNVIKKANEATSKKIVDSDGKIHPSITSAAENIGIKRAQLSRMLRGVIINTTNLNYA